MMSIENLVREEGRQEGGRWTVQPWTCAMDECHPDVAEEMECRSLKLINMEGREMFPAWRGTTHGRRMQ